MNKETLNYTFLTMSRVIGCVSNMKNNNKKISTHDVIRAFKN